MHFSLSLFPSCLPACLNACLLLHGGFDGGLPFLSLPRSTSSPFSRLVTLSLGASLFSSFHSLVSFLEVIPFMLSLLSLVALKSLCLSLVCSTLSSRGCAERKDRFDHSCHVWCRSPSFISFLRAPPPAKEKESEG